MGKYPNDNVNHSKRTISLTMLAKAADQGNFNFFTSGFTLVELIVSIAIIGLLATMAIPAYSRMKTSAKIARAESELRTIDKAINAFVIDKNRLPDPSNFSEIGPEGSLVDPWGTPYQYSATPAYKDSVDPLPFNDDYDLYSKGADRDTDVQLPVPPNKNKSSDDIIRVRNGGSIVLGESY